MALARFTKQALIGGLAVIGALYLGFHALMWMISPGEKAPSSAEIVSSVLAPDGQHKAVIFFLAGPGFAPGWHQYVGVVAAGTGRWYCLGGPEQGLPIRLRCAGRDRGSEEKERGLEIGGNPANYFRSQPKMRVDLPDCWEARI
jgi:hypothetical protein